MNAWWPQGTQAALASPPAFVPFHSASFTRHNRLAESKITEDLRLWGPGEEEWVRGMSRRGRSVCVCDGNERVMEWVVRTLVRREGYRKGWRSGKG